jgi:hypothetical protein
LKEVTDDDIGNLAASGDARVSSTTNSYANQAVEFGQYEAADDGNVYLMRWTLPTIFYAISPGGKVVRRFVVDPGDEGFAPVAMHIASNRIAVLFFHEQTKEKRMKIVDLEGHEIATYEEARIGGKTKNDFLGLAFACYTANPQRFTFLHRRWRQNRNPGGGGPLILDDSRGCPVQVLLGGTIRESPAATQSMRACR